MMPEQKDRYVGAVIGTGRIGMLLEQDPLRLKPATHVISPATGFRKNRSASTMWVPVVRRP